MKNDPAQAVAMWNAEVPIGRHVTYRKDDGSIVETRTRSRAQVLGNHTPVVWLEEIVGCIALDRVAPKEGNRR
jgi:hypothetical protein